jgi:rhodanese-related sulfurtransferase
MNLLSQIASPIKPTRRQWAALACSLVLTAHTFNAAAEDADSVSLETARKDLESGQAVLIDIRETNEHATGVAKGAKLLPMSALGARLADIPTADDKPVYLICNTQNRSSKTLAALRQRGYKHVRYVKGGMSEWVKRGWPVVKP